MDLPEFTVPDFDGAVLSALERRRSRFHYERKEAGGTVIYAISDKEGELGDLEIGPGIPPSSYVMLTTRRPDEECSVGAPWFAFYHMNDPERAVDERNRKFRTLCRRIFDEFGMKHRVDTAGRPIGLWKYAEQNVTPSKDDPAGKRGKNIGTAEKVAKVLLILESKGDRITQKRACHLAGTSPKTFRKYRDDPEVLSTREWLRQDRDFLDEVEGI